MTVNNSIPICTFSLFIALAMFFLILFNATAEGSQKQNKSDLKVINGVTEDIYLDDFISMTIPDYASKDSASGECFLNCRNVPRLEKRYPFLIDAAQHKNGIPKKGVISKWKETEVTVGFGWPKYQMPAGRALIEEKYAFLKEVEPLLLEEIRLFNSFGLINLRYIPPMEEEKEAAQIRIDPFSLSEPHISTKIWYDEHGILWAGTLLYDLFVSYGVRFTGGSDFNVDGYFVPDNDNNIILAVCHPNIALPKKVLSSHIQECLFRSLGIPGISTLSKGILSKRKSYSDAVRSSSYDVGIIKKIYSSEIKSGFSKEQIVDSIKGGHIKGGRLN